MMKLLWHREGTDMFSVNFDHVLYKAKNDIPNGSFDASSIKNMDPVFDTIDVSHNYYDFHLKDNSPAIDAGTVTTFSLDLDDKTRDANPDIGCYEN